MAIEGVEIKKGNESGPCVAIFGGVHGNERCGIEVIDALRRSLIVQRGSVYLVYGNPLAIQKNTRFVDVNLNRIFRPASELVADELGSYEFKRAEELMPILNQCESLLDIHSSATINAVPFIICEPRAFAIAKRLPFPIRSRGWDTLEPGGTDYYVNRNGKLGLCIECGYHDDPCSLAQAQDAAVAFLKISGVIDGEIPPETREQQQVYVRSIYLTKTNFIPSRTFSDFEFLNEGTLIGFDGKEAVTLTEDGLLIFCRRRGRPGEEAFLTGVKE